jgi:hypothetical protein
MNRNDLFIGVWKWIPLYYSLGKSMLLVHHRWWSRLIYCYRLLSFNYSILLAHGIISLQWHVPSQFFFFSFRWFMYELIWKFSSKFTLCTCILLLTTRLIEDSKMSFMVWIWNNSMDCEIFTTLSGY